jgi:hypothetical protein
MIFLKIEEGKKYSSEIENMIHQEYNSGNIFDFIKIKVQKSVDCFELNYQFFFNTQKHSEVIIAIPPDKDLLKEHLNIEYKIAKEYNFKLNMRLDLKILH